MKPEPEGLCKIVGVEHDRPPRHFAIYAKIIVEDEAGKRWFFTASAFNFDLKPEPERPE